MPGFKPMYLHMHVKAVYNQYKAASYRQHTASDIKCIQIHIEYI